MPTFLLGLVAVAGLAVIVTALVRHRTLTAQKETRDKELREAIRRAVAKGTHNDRGEPLCRICGDKDCPESVATDYGYCVVRDRGIAQWIRELVGAPTRYRIGRLVDDEKAYCRLHAELAGAELRAYLLQFEQRQADHILNTEVELQRFERIGLNEILRARVQDHEKAVKRDAARPLAKVVQIR